MEKIITYENIKSFAYVNDAICKKPIRGVIIFFNGLNWREMHSVDPVEGEYFAEKGILYVVPYNNPWAWMNRQAVSYTDEIMDVLFEKHGLSKKTPIVSTGKSMGGLSSLVYMVYTKRTPIACVADCPVCDGVYHFTEREDLPRTMYSALYGEPGTLEDALKSISPLHLIEKMPKARYHLLHCDKDTKVNIEKHSKAFVSELKKRSYSVTLDVIPGRTHCDLDYKGKRLFAAYAVDAIDAYLKV